MTELDFYATLGVQRTASALEIKKAYRRLALQHHPDKNAGNTVEAEKMFKKVSEAYATLSDSEKRRRYDLGEESPQSRQYSREGRSSEHGRPSRHYTSSHFDMRDAERIFASFFASGDPFANMEQGFDTFFSHSTSLFDNSPFFSQGARGIRRQQTTPVGRSAHHMESRFPPMQEMNMNMMSQDMGGMFNRESMFGGMHGFGRSASGLGDFTQHMSQMQQTFGGNQGSTSFRGSSSSSQTYVANGKRITRTEEKWTNPDGTTGEKITQEEMDPHGRTITFNIDPRTRRPLQNGS